MSKDDDIALPASADHIGVLYPSQYLKKEDLRGKDVRLTISRVTFRNVRMSNNTRERKVVIHFQEMQRRPEEERKVWIVGKTCAQLIAEIHGPNPHAWVGKQIVIYADTGVMFGRQRVGGIRVRVTTPSETPVPEPEHAQAGDEREPGID